MPDEQAENLENADHDLFVRLIMRHDRAVRAYLRSLLPTAADVDEVMQEVSVVAWRKFDQLGDQQDFPRWVCVIARYEVLMYRRKKARDRLVLGEEIEHLMADEGLQELSLRQQQLDALERCLDKLPNERKQLVLKTYAAEQPMKTIAGQLGKTPAALYQILSRVRRDLLACVEQTLAAEGTS
ncbi:MAG: sigma-70 family RNA polymerase sigma factor [Planctomycetales bacterium]